MVRGGGGGRRGEVGEGWRGEEMRESGEGDGEGGHEGRERDGEKRDGEERKEGEERWKEGDS